MAIDKSKLEEDACVLRFYKIVLGWDYLRLLTESQKRNFNKKTGSDAELKEVKDTYTDVDDYLDTFEPLLFEEVKAQIVKDQSEEEKTEWQLAYIRKCSEEDGFHLPTIICTNPELMSQNDLVVFSTAKLGDGTMKPTYAFAFVENREHDLIRLRLYLGRKVKRFNTDDVETCPRLLSMIDVVKRVQTLDGNEGKKEERLFVRKICSLSTIVREYVAMQSIRSLPFKDLILKAADMDKDSEDRAWKISKPLTESIESNHNKSQLEAIYAGLSRKPFVLIQGPPGTGKTQTILGLLSAILHATPAGIHSNNGKVVGVNTGRPEMSYEEKRKHWTIGSPWLYGASPRDMIMPIDGDDGFYPTSGNDMKPEVVNSSRKYRVRVLVCAPSNSALDEIVLRLINTGIRDENDHAYSPKIVRIGLKAHHSVQSVSMDYLVGQKLGSTDSQAGDKQKQGGVAKDKDSIRASILDEAVIVFSTLSFSGSSLFSKLNRGFDVVIIDEAAQAVEPATLVPLASGCKQVFLVGDPVQLPATVISPVAQKFGYGTSLFTRFQRAGYPVQMLKTQYRMNPEIRSFPSREFYDEALEDGPDVEEQTKRAWHRYHCFGPFCFFDIHEGTESQPAGGSWVNVDEVEFVLALYSKLINRYPELKASSRLAIISPYRQQVKLLREKFRSTFGVESDNLVDINTVDGFQGREKDVAIFSCVRASKDNKIGFVEDFRRMNVGITRARSSVLVVGSASTLKREDGHWKNLVESAEQRNVLLKVSKPYTEYFSEANLTTMEVKGFMPENPEEPAEQDMDVDVAIDNSIAHVDPEPEDYGDADDGGDFGGDD